MGLIAIEGMKFYAYHGVFKEEQENGNHFQVDLYVKTDFAEAAAHDDLSETVDYSALYDTVKATMDEKYKLLEHVAYEILQAIERNFAAVNHARVRVYKLEPPIEGDVQRVYIEHERHFARI